VAAEFYQCQQDGFKAMDLAAQQADLPNTDQYWFGICQELSKLVGDLDIKFFGTDNWQSLPMVGKNVFVLLLSDEWGHVPLYAGKIGGIFRTMSHIPANENRLGNFPPPIRLALAKKYATRWFRGRWGVLKAKLGSPLPPNIHSIPIGYYNQGMFQMKTIQDRDVDVFFAGQMIPEGVVPKTAQDHSRREMQRAVEHCQHQLPNLRFDVSRSHGFGEKTGVELTYAERLANSKISLCPRGSQPETFRFFESIRAGCVTICEKQPPGWFYEGHPGLELASWDQLPTILEQLFTQGLELETRHRANLDYWQNRVSERPVAEFIARKIRERLKP
jgi:hypothetical protein